MTPGAAPGAAAAAAARPAPARLRVEAGCGRDDDRCDEQDSNDSTRNKWRNLVRDDKQCSGREGSREEGGGRGRGKRREKGSR